MHLLYLIRTTNQFNEFLVWWPMVFTQSNHSWMGLCIDTLNITFKVNFEVIRKIKTQMSFVAMRDDRSRKLVRFQTLKLIMICFTYLGRSTLVHYVNSLVPKPRLAFLIGEQNPQNTSTKIPCKYICPSLPPPTTRPDGHVVRNKIVTIDRIKSNKYQTVSHFNSVKEAMHDSQSEVSNDSSVGE